MWCTVEKVQKRVKRFPLGLGSLTHREPPSAVSALQRCCAHSEVIAHQHK